MKAPYFGAFFILNDENYNLQKPFRYVSSENTFAG